MNLSLRPVLTMFIRRTLFLVFAVAPLFCQYYDLATTADGSTVYFATMHRRAGTEEVFQGRIYIVDHEGLRLYAARDEQYPPNPEPGAPVTSNFFDLSAPEVSSDGQMVAFAGRRNCTSGRDCIGVRSVATTITGLPSGEDLTVFGRVRFSANGRYGLRYGEAGIGAGSPGLLDLKTGTETLMLYLGCVAEKPWGSTGSTGDRPTFSCTKFYAICCPRG